MININGDEYIRDHPDYDKFMKKMKKLESVFPFPIDVNVNVPMIQFKSVVNGKWGDRITEIEKGLMYHLHNQKSRTGKWMGSHNENSLKIKKKGNSLQGLINSASKYLKQLERIEGYGRGNNINIVRYSTEYAI